MSRSRIVTLALTSLALVFMVAPAATAQTANPCDAPANAIVAENCQPGSPPSEWDISGAGDANIQGFATDISVDQGQTVQFKVRTDANAYHLDIYRMGYYGGLGARRVATVRPTASLPQSQPACLTDDTTGLIDCGNWSVSASWDVPADATSGIYFAKLVREDGVRGESHIVFIVRDDDGGSQLLFQTSDTTWQAYNQFGGNSLYVGSPAGRAYKVSYNRPITTRGTSAEDFVFNAEYPMVRWLEANGYDVSYFTGVDSDRHGAELLEHQVFLSVGHDEYWSGQQRANVEAARAAGVHLAFFSGNEVFWKTRWETSIDGSGTPHRTLVCYKETHAGAKIDPLPDVWTGTWRDSRDFNPEGPQPENGLTGNIFTVNCCTYAIEVPPGDGQMRIWRNTSIAELLPGQVATLPGETLGYEWNEDLDNGARPPGLIRLSSTTVDVPQILLDQGSTYGPGRATHSLTLYKDATSGALVFNTGTVQWSWGLDENHDRGSNPPDSRMQQATVNLFADMGVQPATLQSDLLPATGSSDVTAPTVAIDSPAGGSTFQEGAAVTLSGTASDVGGVIGGVEVSVDGGATWHRAEGRGAWSYTWVPSAAGTYSILARATDDSANLGAPSAALTVTIVGATCPCSVWNDTEAPEQANANDGQPLEVGVRFRTDVDGTITGLRFYKGTQNTGTHVGHLWLADGTLLAEATFSNESASGWQEVTFATPIAIAANTQYVASYYSPTGYYADTVDYFDSSGVDRGYLHFPQSQPTAPNGVYKYGASGFPTSGTTENYWVDVVFMDQSGPDQTPPAVTRTAPAANATAVSTTSSVSATFSEQLDPASVSIGTFQVAGPDSAPIAGTVTWNATSRTATFDPDAPLAGSSAYTATLVGGSGGVRDLAGNALAADFSWSFTTAAPPPPPPDEGPGGPILVIADASNPFGRYFAEILRAEGLNAFTVTDIALVTPSVLAAHDVAILAEMPLTSTQVSLLSDWVNAGGNLIAMRPSPQLAGLLGLSDTPESFSEGYLRVNASTSPGAGIVTDTIQFHGTADLYALAGATAIATLYSNATTPTPYPAVTLRAIGSNGGQAAAFTYDLARSIVYTRQGNPAWAGQERDGVTPIRSDDLFFGGAQPDWVDLDKVGIPQADEQQRLLANLILVMNQDRKPLPRFWYFPRDEKAVVVMTGDDHGNGGTAGRFDQYRSASPAGCSVEDWECIRSTSYIYPGTPLTPEQAAAYEAQGFEIGVHFTTNCSDFTPSSLEATFDDQLGSWEAKYAGAVSPPVTNRTHCIVWSDWSTHPKVELGHGIRLDTNYYYWPGSWLQDRPGYFTGSGMPMRFADLDGTIIDVYQATTQMTDESEQSYPLHIDFLLDQALGTHGFYGAFTANMHNDSATSAGADAIIQSALARGVPVVSSRQMLQWLDGRNGSSFRNLAWDGSALSFDLAVGAGARGLRGMLPTSSTVGRLSGLTRDGTPVAFRVQTVKGLEYAFFDGAPGSYRAVYAVDSTPPVISSVAVTPGTDNNATLSWSTDESSDSRVDFGVDPGALAQTVSTSSLGTDHQLTLTGLTPGATYYYRVSSADASSNRAYSPALADPPANFLMPFAALVDTTVADFNGGTPDATTAVVQLDDGAVILAPTEGSEFEGAALPGGWSVSPWNTGGTATVSGGAVAVDSALLATDASYGPGRALDFTATFSATHFQHVGFGQTLATAAESWAMFSTYSTGTGLYARTNLNGAINDVAIPGAWLGAEHRFRIEWATDAVRFFIDGNLVHTQSVTIPGPMRLVISDLDLGGPAVRVSSLRMSPYASSGTFASRVFDAGSLVGWTSPTWQTTLPSGTSIQLSVRSGDTATPDASWTVFHPVTPGDGTIIATSRYLQYQATLSTTDATMTPALERVAFSAVEPSNAPPEITGLTATPNGDGTATIRWTTNTVSDSRVDFGVDAAALTSTVQDPALVFDHQVLLTGLSPSTTYYFRVTSTDSIGQATTAPSPSAASFTTPFNGVSGTMIDTLVADFEAGTLDANASVMEMGNGELLLAPEVGTDFSGTSLPIGWSSFNWGTTGIGTAAGGSATVDGARVATDGLYGAGRSLEFVATFGAAPFQHVGFGQDLADTAESWAMFSTANGTTGLYARTDANGTVSDVLIPGTWRGSPHRYRIEWTSTQVDFYIDGTLVHSQPVAITGSMRPVISDFAEDGTTLSVDWVRMSAYPGSSRFLSRVFDASTRVAWDALQWEATTGTGTSIALSARSGDTPVPDGTWSSFVPIAQSGDAVGLKGRYLQYAAELSTNDPMRTPVLSQVSVGFAEEPNAAPVANGDAYTAQEDTPLVVTAGTGVLSNDSDADGDPLSASLQSGPTHGTVALDAEGGFTYTPAPGFNGTDSFTYVAGDGEAQSEPATVTLSVSAVNDPPVCIDQGGSISEGGVLSGSVSCTDPDGDPLTYQVVTDVSRGTLVLDPNGAFTYTPAPDFNGTDVFTFTASDSQSASNESTFTIEVGPTNDAPVAADDSYQTPEDQPLTVAAPGLLSNDVDVDGDPLTAVIVNPPVHGTLTAAPDGSFTYVPAPDFNGIDGFTYRARDAALQSADATVQVTVTPVNDPPVCTDQRGTTTEGTALTAQLQCTDVDGDALVYRMVSGVTHGTLVLDANGLFTYTPDAGFSGTDGFTFAAGDGTADSNAATFTSEVGAASHAPVAVDDSFTTQEDAALSVAAPGLLANDTDADGDSLTVVFVSPPAHGALQAQPDGSFTYTPAPDYNGDDSFTYRAGDAVSTSNLATVRLTVAAVNDPPTCAEHASTISEDTRLIGSVQCTDVDGDPLTYVKTIDPANGTLVLNPDGTFAYTPNPDFSGSDNFGFRASDGRADSNTAAYRIEVGPVNDLPVANADAWTTNEDVALNIPAPGVLANDRDADGDALTVISVTQPSHGTVSAAPDGAFTYVPLADHNGTVSFTYQVSDGIGTATGSVSITIAPVDDPPRANADAYQVDEGATLTIPAPGLLGNDTEPDGEPLSASLVSAPLHGTVFIAADGSFVYQPASGYTGADAFAYAASDGQRSSIATVALTVVPVNDAPIVTSDSYPAVEDQQLVVTAPGVLGNDSDPDGDALTATIITQPSHGSISLNRDGSFTYVPAQNYSGPDTFTYAAADGSLQTSGTVSITVTPVNDAPVVFGKTYTTGRNTTLRIGAPGVLANDTDPEGSPLTAILAEPPVNGTLALNADGSFEYAPNAEFVGKDTFLYRASDGELVSGAALVTVNVTRGGGGGGGNGGGNGNGHGPK